MTFKLTDDLEDVVELGEDTYELDISLGTVLKLFEMIDDDEVEEELKPLLGLNMLTGLSPSTIISKIDISEALELFERIVNECIRINDDDNSPQVDLQGNPLPQVKKATKKQLLDIEYDSEAIYSSFLQAYGIDLMKEKYNLHWKKFNALLSGLPRGTKLIEIIEIRSWEPQKGDSSKYKSRMRELQRIYRLPH